MELYKKHRPKILKNVIGQDEAITTLKSLLAKDDIPHALLFTGPSGCGKTTLARILQKKLNCDKTNFYEINAADFKGIDTIRDIRRAMNTVPLMGSKCKIWLMDEAHKLSNDAQTAFLKMLEDTPEHVYFFLATTDPQKLLATIKTRCTFIKVKPLSQTELLLVIQEVLSKEGITVTEEVSLKICDHSDGSARKALVILNQIVGLETEDEQLEAIHKMDADTEAIQICRCLINPRSTWKEMAAILKEVKEEPESLRYMILGYFTTVLLNRGDRRSAAIIEVFSSNFYDSKRSGLVLACFEAIAIKG